jgi:peptidoglycan/LPS O-acetylase OafA/YrhL
MPKEPALRLHFLDGLRGLAGLYVLLFHESTPKFEVPGELSPALKVVHAFLEQGRHSVVFFIVLSGFSLMLPVVRAGNGELVGGFRRYISRRARRILPPYYAALVGSIALILVYNRVGARLGGAAPVDAALSPGSLISHLFLLHNLNFDWTFRINGPMWSVATEWEIYFIFALVLLPLARKVGMPITVILAWVLSSLPIFVLPDSVNLYWASPWFVGSFALGAYGAHLCFSGASAPATRLSSGGGQSITTWVVATWAMFAIVVGIAVLQPAWPYPLIDLPISLFAFCWINACVALSQDEKGKRNPMLRVLESRTMVTLGAFSYSVYLVQHPLLRLSEKAFNRMGLSHDANLLAHLFIVTPIVLAAAWVFSELFERPFTSGGILLPMLRRRFAARAAA